MRLLALVFLVGCTAPGAITTPDPGTRPVDPGDPTAPTDPTEPTGPTDPTDPTQPIDASADMVLVDALLAGDAAVDDVLQQVAWSGGWPVLDDDGLAWFVHRDASGPWSVAGDFDDWQPEAMTQGDGFWWAAVDVGDPAGQGYKFVSGDTWIADPLARSYTHDAYGELSFVDAPTDRARLDRWPQLAAEGLAPRDLRVYVPPGAGPWPVLYAHDGQNLFDPGAIWGGWRLLDALQGRDVVVVGIDNTIDRMDEYTHVPDDVGFGSVLGGEGDAYAALVHDHARPHIEAVYGSTGHDGVLGSSLGGLISLHVAWTYPGEYDFAASLSGTLGWGRFALAEPTMEERYLAQAPSALTLYVDSGGDAGPDGVCRDLDGDGFPEDDPDSSDNYCTTRQFVDSMAANGFTWDVDLFHWHDAGAPHAEIAWADRVHRPLDVFLAP